MAALNKKGLIVQGFKCGPDYIDPSYHTAVTKRNSRNLDSWMLEEETIIDILTHASVGADISVMEGVMGFYDGRDPSSNEGSTAEIAMMTESPVLLVVNCAAMARSAAAIVKGFQQFADGPNIIGVIANKVGSEGHFQLIKEAIEQECNIPVLGYLKQELNIEIPERSLGLVPSIERGELDPFFDRIGELILETVDVDRLLSLSEAPPLQVPQATSLFTKKEEHKVTIAVAKDAAFNSYYIENLEILESYGAKLVYFSPLANEPVPSHADGLYIGGSLPDEFVPKLAKSDRAKESIYNAIQNGLPTFAECGGFMYLTKSIETTVKEEHPMIGIVPGKVINQTKLAAIGYREVYGRPDNILFTENEIAKGHEFHYSTFESEHGDIPHAYETVGRWGTKQEGYATSNIVAGFTQLHFASCLSIVKRWIQLCVDYKNK